MENTSIESVNMSEPITEWRYPFHNLNAESKELINTNPKCRLLYTAIVELPIDRRMEAANACLQILEGKTTAEEMIARHNGMGRE